MIAPDSDTPLERPTAKPARAPTLRRRAVRWARRVAWVVLAVGVVGAIGAAWFPKPRPVDAATARLGDSDDKKREAPKWQRVIQSLEWMLASLGPETRFQILLFNEFYARFVKSLLDLNDFFL